MSALSPFGDYKQLTFKKKILQSLVKISQWTKVKVTTIFNIFLSLVLPDSPHQARSVASRPGPEPGMTFNRPQHCVGKKARAGWTSGKEVGGGTNYSVFEV